MRKSGALLMCVFLKMSLNFLDRLSGGLVQFPVGRIHRLLKARVVANGRVGATAAVYGNWFIKKGITSFQV